MMYERYCHVTTHLGVKIFKSREMIVGSDIRELKDGRIIPCKPKYEYAFQYAGSYPYDTEQECKEAIERVRDAYILRGLPIDEEWKNIMNEE